MRNATRLISKAAAETVRDVAEPYDGYHAQLVLKLADVIRVLHIEPSTQGQRRAIRTLVTGFAGEVDTRIEGHE